MKKKILINITSQFGYHTDTYMYCKYLDKSKYEIHYIGFDFKLPPFVYDDKDLFIHLVAVDPNKVKRYWIYLSAINKLIRKEKFDLVFQVDHKLTLLVRLCNLNRKFMLDIRTGDLSHSSIKRSFLNNFILFTSFFYNRISVISEGLRKKLRIPTNKSEILPLGAELRSSSPKNWNELHLFYIGTLQNRNINQTIIGLSQFLIKNPTLKVSYDIVGMGTDTDLKVLSETIERFNLKNTVTFHGQKKHDDLVEVWEKANVGVVYVPITPYYNFQPSTKLYECLLAGMAVIATNTNENKREIEKDSGVIIDDTSDDFERGLEEIVRNRHLYNSTAIKEKYKENAWQTIVKNKLEPILDK